MTIQVRELARTDWKRFFSLNETSPQGSVFCTESWVDTVSGVLHRKQEPKIYIAEKNGEILAGCLVMANLERRTSFRDLPFTPYTGVIMDHAVSDLNLIRAIENAFIDTLIKPHSFQLKLSPDYLDPRQFLWKRVNLNPLWTFRITKDHWQRHREKIKTEKCIDQVEPQTVCQSNDAALLQSLWRMTYTPRDSTLSDRFLAHAIKCQWARFYICRDVSGEPCCGMLYLRYRNIGYGCATFHNGKIGREYDRLRFHVLDTELNGQIDVFDWCGANVPSRNTYKADFMPLLTPYYQLVHGTGSPDLGWLVSQRAKLGVLLKKVGLRK
ncbi:MAG: hypothetical protein KF752_20170 [Pirellulaceae bacterium]|nr:hypothetical protein [Pirellulaceae bacterium]